MIMWLDHKIFGNGHGVGAPFCDQKYYWLVDTLRKERSERNGEIYTFWPGFGAQLHSFQWFHPKPGERRRLAGHEFTAFISARRWFRVTVSWAIVGLPEGIDEKNAFLREFERDYLGRTS